MTVWRESLAISPNNRLQARFRPWKFPQVSDCTCRPKIRQEVDIWAKAYGTWKRIMKISDAKQDLSAILKKSLPQSIFL